ncbi:MAG: PHP domain-containing protein [Myxococcales bacterium]|nr:PHP domain-containing protein [Myxococcales bacterium]
MPARWCVAVVATLALIDAGCGRDSCLGGDCEATTPCGALAFRCAAPRLYVGGVAAAPGELGLARGQGAADDVLLSNGVVTAVISAVGAPTDLAPTGGVLIDLGPSGGADDLTILYQLAGLLPDDAFAYDRLEVVDRSPAYVAVIARGHLDGRPEVAVATRYELRPCDPGLRVRSELFNDSPDRQAFVIADAAHWGKRRVVPFAPVVGQGYLTPPLELLELTALWKPYPFVAAAAPAPAAPAYGVVACDRPTVAGVNDLEVSALGTPIEVVPPGQGLVFERFVVAAPATDAGGGPAAAVAALVAARGQLFGAASMVVTGAVQAEGLAFGGDVRRASIVIRGGDDDAPLTAVVPAADGGFRAVVPARAELSFELWSFGRRELRGPIPDDGALGVLTVPAPATVDLHVVRAGGGADLPIDAVVVFEPADDATRAGTRGSLHGKQTPCAPWLGPPHGASPACNRVLVEPAGTQVEVPAGHYWVFASAGPDATVARAEVRLDPGELTAVDLALRDLDVTPPGWLAADLHVHGAASFDSGLPDRDRVRSFLAAGVDVIAATDHDYVTDYAATVRALGAEDRLLVMGGLETTPLIPFLDVPGEDLPRVIGHFNFWPLTPLPASPRGGAPWDERLEPGALFDRLDPLIGADGVRMINHPWDEPQFGRDLGYLRAIGFDPRRPVPTTDDGTPNGALARRPGGGHANLDWDALEVGNGAGADEWQKNRLLWFALASAGHPVVGTANSDSHGLRDNQLGWGRTWVEAGTPIGATDAAGFDRALKAGKVVAGSGVFIAVTIGPPGAPRRGLGLAPVVPQPGDVVTIEVRAAPWIPVTSVRAVTSRGERALAADLVGPADPFGVDGVVRWRGEVPLAELVAGADDWLVIEAGLPPPRYADLDDDGVPDTGDNDGDGDVDLDDVEPDEDVGPIANPPDPTDPADPRFVMTRLVPESWPYGFTGLLLIDVAGDGWTAPGSAR